MMQALYLVPGTMCDHRLWTGVLACLPNSQAVHADYSVADTMEGMLDLVLGQAPERCHLVGFSLGGYLAAMAAIQQPERFESLTIIAASPFGLTDGEKQLRLRNAEMLTRLKYKGMSKARLKQFVHESHLGDEGITGTILQMEKDLGQDVLIRQLIAPIDRPDISRELLALQMPVRFIMAKDDQLVPIGAIEKLAAKSDHITLHRIENSGHMIPLEAPEELATLLQT